jgi:putative phosphoesterase
VRIGVVADTHVGDLLPELPGEVCEALAGVDLILHAGDIIDPAALDVLRAVAPVVAVRGNHDEREGHRDLPRDVLVRVGGARIGLTHGHRRAAVELPAIAVSLVAGRPCRPGFERAMRRRFPGADCVVVGHFHEAIHHRVRGVLLFSPGAVYSAEHDPEYDWNGLGSKAYRRYRRGLAPEAHRPAVGLIEAGPGVLRTRVIPLLRPIRAAA